MALFKEIVLVRRQIDNEQEKCKNLFETLNAKLKLNETNSNFMQSLLNRQNLPLHFMDNTNNFSISLLAIHLQSVLINTKNKNTLLSPFSKLLDNPSAFVTSFLPSIPHDDDYEIYKQFKQINNENLKFYQCKNGHYYGIGECTKPATNATCPTCGDRIGGQGHKLAEGNKEATDLTEKAQNAYYLPNAEY